MKCNICGNGLGIMKYGTVTAYFCKCGHRSVSVTNHDSNRKQIGHISLVVLEEMGFGSNIKGYNKFLKDNEARKLRKKQKAQ